MPSNWCNMETELAIFFFYSVHVSLLAPHKALRYLYMYIMCPHVPCPCLGAKLTQEELGDLMGRLASVTTTLQEREKAKKGPELDFNLPKLPDWLTARPYLTRDFVVQSPLISSPPRVGVVEGVALGSLPVAMQEQAILEDLLSTMMGQDGR